MTDTTANLPPQIIECIRRALDEDIGRGDVTTRSITSVQTRTQAHILAKQEGVIAGLDVARAIFLHLDHEFVATAHFSEGENVQTGRVLAELFGSARALLSGERTALNFIGRMSGIATLTRQFVDEVAGTGAVILDTRKTAPGLRAVDKLAVLRGGGQNHRAGLFDQVLLKDNHIELAGSLAEAVRRVRESNADITRGNQIGLLPPEFAIDGQGEEDLFCLEVEVRTLEDLRAAIDLGVERIMLDNMSVDLVREAVKMTSGRAKLEASGNVTLENVRRIAETGVHFISVGALTHSPTSFDVSLKFTSQKTND